MIAGRGYLTHICTQRFVVHNSKDQGNIYLGFAGGLDGCVF